MLDDQSSKVGVLYMHTKDGGSEVAGVVFLLPSHLVYIGFWVSGLAHMAPSSTADLAVMLVSH